MRSEGRTQYNTQPVSTIPRVSESIVRISLVPAKTIDQYKSLQTRTNRVIKPRRERRVLGRTWHRLLRISPHAPRNTGCAPGRRCAIGWSVHSLKEQSTFRLPASTGKLRSPVQLRANPHHTPSIHRSGKYTQKMRRIYQIYQRILVMDSRPRLRAAVQDRWHRRSHRR